VHNAHLTKTEEQAESTAGGLQPNLTCFRHEGPCTVCVTEMPEERRVIKETASSPALILHEVQSKLTFRLPSTSVFGASLMIFKAIVGAGLFALPYAFSLLGYAGATAVMAFVGLLTFYTGMVVIRVHDVVVRDTLSKGTTYVSLAQHCFGVWAARVVYFLVVFTTLGCNGAFLVFIGSVLHSVW
jgi:hypothetical protein